jgi:mannose-6-phosphate isomerase class I
VNIDGRLFDLFDPAAVSHMRGWLKSAEQASAGALVIYKPGAMLDPAHPTCDINLYFDKTRQPLLWQMWDGALAPLGHDTPDPTYGWKEYYYCDFYLLDRHKHQCLQAADFWVEAIEARTLKMMPRATYDALCADLVRRPIKEVNIIQPGPWGAYRYRDLFDVPGLGCNAWHELAGPELSVLVDAGRGELINFPFMNLMRHADMLVGPHIAQTYPGLFPMDVWLDDGYFPTPQPAERISMPIHNHPGTDYVKQHFAEPIGRYETYYIAEAYEGANTWHGYTENADLEEWERLCRASNNLTPIPNWKDYIANWQTNVGDLFLIPPGTVHGHGGNQMVLEMDTCPSIAGTEYSFFLYDFARNSWDESTKSMTGKPCKMHLEHGFDNEKWVRSSYSRDNLQARPRVARWTKEYQFDRYSSDPRMPFEIERFHFDARAENDTVGRFANILTLTVGTSVTIQSLDNPSLSTTLLKYQSAVVPACFGRYEIRNNTQGQCTVVQLRWKNG